MTATRLPKDTKITIRSATPADTKAIHACIEPFVAEKKVLRRTFNELETLIPQYLVAEAEGRIVGCVVLEVYSPKLAEIRSLVVAEECQGLGIGKRMVDACVERAKREHIFEVMAITSQDGFFQGCGFDYTLPGEKRALFMQLRDEM
jgi:N-acetylglutamate synthase-like GNAT family acetyltransferase